MKKKTWQTVLAETIRQAPSEIAPDDFDARVEEVRRNFAKERPVKGARVKQISFPGANVVALRILVDSADIDFGGDAFRGPVHLEELTINDVSLEKAELRVARPDPGAGLSREIEVILSGSAPATDLPALQRLPLSMNARLPNGQMLNAFKMVMPPS